MCDLREEADGVNAQVIGHAGIRARASPGSCTGVQDALSLLLGETVGMSANKANFFCERSCGRFLIWYLSLVNPWGRELRWPWGGKP
jgi:hypothetical protein